MKQLIDLTSLFERLYALAEFGEYSDGDDYSTFAELPDGVAITLSIDADTMIKVTENEALVFHAIENYDRELDVLIFENGSWIKTVNDAYLELQQ